MVRILEGTVRALFLVFGSLEIACEALDAQVQTPAWRTLSPANRPPARFNHAMTLDESTGRIVVFGGMGGFVQALNDTWEWDGANWSRTAGSPAPSASYVPHAFAYHTGRQSLVLVSGETWEYRSRAWARVSLQLEPPAGGFLVMDRSRGVMVYCASEQLWEWQGSTWVPILVTLPRASPQTAYFDASLGECVFVYRDFEAWRWNGARWLRHQAAGATSYQSVRYLAFDVRRSVRIWSVEFSYGPPTYAWYRDYLGTGLRVTSGYLRTAAWDPARGTTVFFGGGGGGWNGEDTTMEYGLLHYEASAVAYGAGCPGSVPVTLTGIGAPIVGSSTLLQASSLPPNTSFAALALGFSRDRIGAFTLPIPLDYLGMPGCSLLQSMEVPALPLALSPPTATMSLTIPLDYSLLERSIYLQAQVVAPGVNALGVATSNGLRLVFGN